MELEEIREPKSLFSDFEEGNSEAFLIESEEIPTLIKPTFWQRQFLPQTTAKQTRFDWVFGVILPIICFAFDPIVFRDGDALGMWLGKFQVFAYVLSIASIMSMAAWLLWRERLGWAIPFLAGLFAAGSVVSLIVGIALLPLSLLGLIILIGVLGFTPFFTAFVYLRNSYRALYRYDLFGETKYSVRAFILAAVFGVIIPFVIHQQFPLTEEMSVEIFYELGDVVD